MMMQNVLHTRPCAHAYKIQILHEIKDTDRETKVEPENSMLNATGSDDSVLW
jgi:hypothetical protein